MKFDNFVRDKIELIEINSTVVNYMKLAANNHWLNLIIGALILNWVTYYNGYPIIYIDTATYLKSGFNLITPADRPITYGIFCMLTSFYKLSLFFTTFLQNLILSWLLLECFIKCLGKSYIKYFLVSIIPIAFLTGLCWVSNQIFADLFTSFIFLSSFLILTYTEVGKKKLVFLYFLFLWSVGSHLSHISITQLFLYASLPVAVFIINKFLYLSKSIVLKRASALIVIGFLAILLMGAAIAKSSAVFFTGKLCENGILKKYLDENCGTTDYKLCAFKDELTYPATEFVWDPEGATTKLGGWKATREEYGKIDKAIIKNPKYLKMLVVESVKASADQFLLNNIGDGNTGLLNEDNNTSTINRFFPGEFNLYVSSKENKVKGIDFSFFNRIYNVCYILFAFSFVVLFLRKTIRRQFDTVYLLASMVIIGITVNNIVSASLANQINRFGLRVIWLLAFMTVLMVIELFIRPNQISEQFKKN
jgi:hypothetical protein